MVTELWSRPVRVKKGAKWAWIDTTLAKQGDVIKPKVIKGDLSLPSGGGSGTLTTFSSGPKQSLSLSWPSKLPDPTLDGSRATYIDAVGPGADLVITALATGFRYDVVLRERPAKDLQLRIPFQGKGLALREGRGGRLRVTNEHDENVAVTGKPVVRGDRSSKGKGGIGTVETSVDGESGRQTLVVKPNREYLADSSTTYPVTIQSAFSIIPSEDADVWSVFPDTANGDGATLGAGTESDGSTSRAYLKFDTAPLVGQQLSNVTLSLLNIDGPACGSAVGEGIQVRRVTSEWDAAEVTWKSQPSNTAEDAVVNRSSVGGSCDPAPMEWDITAMARQWATVAGNYGVVLKSPTERASANYRVFPSSEGTEIGDPPKITATFAPVGDPVTLYPAGPDGVEVIQLPANWGNDALQMAEPQAHALSDAFERARANPDALADPYVDMVTGQVIIPAATADGRSIGSAPVVGTAYLGLGSIDWTLPGSYTDGDLDEDAEGQPGLPEDYNFSPAVRDVGTSYARFRTILREVLSLTPAQLPGADKIVDGWLSAERNRAIFTVTAVSPELRLALAQRYGTDSVVLSLAPNASQQRSQPRSSTAVGPVSPLATDTRANDNDEYINGGGAYTPENGTPCSMGFAWKTAAGKRLVTAGHCLPTNDPTGRISTYDAHRELTTWTLGTGTVPLPGKNQWLGDSALVVTGPSKTPTASIFTGGPDSSTRRPVKGRYNRAPVIGDLFCLGGKTSGQQCNWKVKVADHWWKTNTGTLDSGTLGEHPSYCADGGDSGGPVYTFHTTVDSTGKKKASAVARGIISSGAGSWFGDCSVTYTDILNVRRAYGGDLLKRR
ncbi:DNRLRE domain-containing protein [Streptosporangium sp. NPDC049644]|uniref:DNRLRE domain-containing protein n=1 Tax=Streptosporangium sp. NPDC049644 TaxID=3155507 RepID=UPI00342E4D4A